jgi:hypothetical protein
MHAILVIGLVTGLPLYKKIIVNANKSQEKKMKNKKTPMLFGTKQWIRETIDGVMKYYREGMAWYFDSIGTFDDMPRDEEWYPDDKENANDNTD